MGFGSTTPLQAEAEVSWGGPAITCKATVCEARKGNGSVTKTASRHRGGSTPAAMEKGYRSPDLHRDRFARRRRAALKSASETDCPSCTRSWGCASGMNWSAASWKWLSSAQDGWMWDCPEGLAY